MRIGFWISITALLTGTNLALAQTSLPRTVAQNTTPAHVPGMVVPVTEPTPQSPEYSSHLAGDANGTNGCCAGPLGQDYRFYGSLEYLLWNFSDTFVPPLGTSFTFPLTIQTVQITNTDGAQTAIQVINNSFAASVTTNPLVAPGTDSASAAHQGGRLTIGAWLDDEKTGGVEVSFLVLDKQSTQFAVASSINPPDRFNVATGLNDSISNITTGGNLGSTNIIQTFPVVLQGQAFTTLSGNTTSAFRSGELNCRTRALSVGSLSFDLFGGLRYMDLEDELNVGQAVSLTIVNNARIRTVPGLVDTVDRLNVLAVDSIRTRNQFFGVQVGGSFDVWFNRMFVTGYSKLALGQMRQSVDIAGNGVINETITSTPVVGGGAPTTTSTVRPLSSGLLSLPQNIGQHTRNKIALIPDLGMNVGYLFTNNLRGYVGFEYIYTNQVVRSGEQVSSSSTNTTITITDPTTLALQRQTFQFQSTRFWTTGVNFGLELRY